MSQDHLLVTLTTSAALLLSQLSAVDAKTRTQHQRKPPIVKIDESYDFDLVNQNPSVCRFTQSVEGNPIRSAHVVLSRIEIKGKVLEAGDAVFSLKSGGEYVVRSGAVMGHAADIKAEVLSPVRKNYPPSLRDGLPSVAEKIAEDCPVKIQNANFRLAPKAARAG